MATQVSLADAVSARRGPHRGVVDVAQGAEDFDFPLAHIQMLGKSDRNILRGGAPWFAPGMALDYLAKHAIDFWLTTEDLPHPTTA